MNIIIFDTETTSLTKPFCYNIGYIIANTETKTILTQHDMVISEVWNNKMLFSTAYYADKREKYIASMKGRNTQKLKWLDAINTLASDIENYQVQHGYAYNSRFDEDVFNFNTEWFKTFNPFDNVAIHDIRAYACADFVGADYKDYCETHKKFTENGNYSTTAETMFGYLMNNCNYVEEHTALADSIIEWAILKESIELGTNILIDLKAPKVIARVIDKTLTIVYNKTPIEFKYKTKVERKSTNTIYLNN